MAKCRWHDLVLLAVLAGVCEEVLFRGVIQPWMAGDDAAHPAAIGFVVALLGSNLLFALLHPVTGTYAVLVGLVGVYLGLVGLLDPLPEGTELAGQGKALLFVSSYLPELLGVCDRIGVMCRGELSEVRPVADWSEQEIIRTAVGQAEPKEVAA